jgi:hypothetical protein
MILSHFKVQDATIGDKKYEKALHYYYAIEKKIPKQIWNKIRQE